MDTQVIYNELVLISHFYGYPGTHLRFCGLPVARTEIPAGARRGGSVGSTPETRTPDATSPAHAGTRLGAGFPTSPPPSPVARRRFGLWPAGGPLFLPVIAVGILEKLLRAKPVVWLLIVLPGLWPAWPFFIRPDHTALADPLEYVLHHLGFLACLLLVAVLALTPLRVLFPRSRIALALNRHRRLIGVSAFTYALLHFIVHLVYEGGLAILASDITKPFLVTGMIALAILFVLAVTSLHVAVRWLGARRWKTLHRTAYVAAALAAYHQAAAEKTFPMQVVWIFGPLVLLELGRIAKQRIRRPETPGGG